MDKLLIITLAINLIALNSLIYFGNDKVEKSLGANFAKFAWSGIIFILMIVLLVTGFASQFDKWHVIMPSLSGGFALFCSLARPMRSGALSIIDPKREKFNNKSFNIHIMLMYVILCLTQLSMAIQYTWIL